MKLINNFKSANFNKRKDRRILFIIIHYTALRNCSEAISYLCNPKNKVSSHFLISQKGEIFCLVDENKRAWHAGISYWNGYRDINSLSLGIELDFSINDSNNKYSKNMINALINLIKNLKKKYNIKNENILGHSDIAPYRKIDPGPKFPWHILQKNNISLYVVNKNNVQIDSIKKWFLKNKINSNKKISLFIFNYLGYDTSLAKKRSGQYIKLLKAYKSHFRQLNDSKVLDEDTLNFMITHFLNIVLKKK